MLGVKTDDCKLNVPLIANSMRIQLYVGGFMEILQPNDPSYHGYQSDRSTHNTTHTIHNNAKANNTSNIISNPTDDHIVNDNTIFMFPKISPSRGG